VENDIATWEFVDHPPSGPPIRYRLEEEQDADRTLRITSSDTLFDERLAEHSGQKVLRLLKTLLCANGDRIGKHKIYDQLWKNGSEQIVEKYVSKLRKLLNDDPAPCHSGDVLRGRIIESIRGAKLRFAAEITTSPTPSARAETNPVGTLPVTIAETGDRSRRDRVCRQATMTMQRFATVRPLLGLNLPPVDFGRSVHFIDRSVVYFEARREKGTAVALTSDARAILDRLQRENVHLGLAAPAGMGKSAFLEHIAHLAAAQLIGDSPTEDIPLLVRLGDIGAGAADGVALQIQNQLIAGYGGALLREDLAASSFIAFLDGLDEIPRVSNVESRAIEAAILDLIGGGIEIRGIRVRARSSVISSRPDGVGLCTLLPHFRNYFAHTTGWSNQILLLRPLTRAEQDQYVDHFFPAVGQNGAGLDAQNSQVEASVRLKEKLHTISGTESPLVLFLFCYLNGQSGQAVVSTDTPTQLLRAAVLQSLTARGIRPPEPYLSACACLAYEHRMKGVLSGTAATAALLEFCASDLTSASGIAALLDIRQCKADGQISASASATATLIETLLCGRSGLLTLSAGHIHPTDVRIGDLLTAEHLRWLILRHRLGFVRSQMQADASAIPCISDSSRHSRLLETVAQAVSRWAWDAAWKEVIHDLAVLLAGDSDDRVEDLVILLGEDMPIPQINESGDDSAGDRVALAAECLLLAKLAGCQGFDAIESALRELTPLRYNFGTPLKTALENLASGRLAPAHGEKDKTPLDRDKERYSSPEVSFADLVAFLRLDGNAELAEAFVRTKTLSNADVLPDSLLVDLAKAFDHVTLLRETTCLTVMRLATLIDTDPLRHRALFDALADRHQKGDSVRRDGTSAVAKLFLNSTLSASLDDTAALRGLFSLHSTDKSLLSDCVSDVFRGVYSWVDRALAPSVDGRRVSLGTVRLLMEYLSCDVPRKCQSSIHESAVEILARVTPPRDDYRNELTGVIGRLLRSGRGPVAIWAIPKLEHYDLDYSELLAGVLEHARRAAQIGAPHLKAALTCWSKLIPRRSLLPIRAMVAGRVSLLDSEHVEIILGYDPQAAEELGILWEALMPSDALIAKYRWNALSMAMCGEKFLQKHAPQLTQSDAFLDRLAKGLCAYPHAGGLLNAFFRGCGSAEAAMQLVTRLFGSKEGRGLLSTAFIPPFSVLGQMKIQVVGQFERRR
jgi:hypothetical protein